MSDKQMKQKNGIPNGVVSAQANPLRDGAVLLRLPAQDALGLEGLVGWLEHGYQTKSLSG